MQNLIKNFLFHQRPATLLHKHNAHFVVSQSNNHQAVDTVPVCPEAIHSQVIMAKSTSNFRT
jgi:hypothetical protein